jgi:hypothetical protein
MNISIDVPEIPDYPKGFPNYWLRSFLIGPISTNLLVNALAGTYVRLVEAALVEYRLGASNLQESWNTGGLNAIQRCVAHFESCLLDMHRAVNFYRRLRRHRGRDPLTLALNAEKPRFAREIEARKLRHMRDEIHHLDEILVNGKLKPGQPIALRPDGLERVHPTELNQTIKSIDRLIIGRRVLLFADLAALLREMGHYAEKISDFGTANATTQVPGGVT